MAMLIAAVAVGGVMLVHAQNLRNVTDNAQLDRAQLVLSNLVQRMQSNRAEVIAGNYDDGFASAGSRAQTVDLPATRGQAGEAGLNGALFSIINNGTGERSVMLQWVAHDANNAVWRVGCGAVVAGRHCLAMVMTP